MRIKHISLLICFLVLACGPKKGIVTKKKKTSKSKTVKVVKNDTKKEEKEGTTRVPNSVDAYIAMYASVAKAEMRKSKIPASITLAQGILESGAGKGRLAVKANNHFGIKCHGWKGAKIYHDDDRSQECFRKYKKAESSYEDHSKFLTGRKRYASLFKLRSNDYKGWARGLRAAGYATDRKYPQKLISLIERYQLYKYDNEVLSNSKEETPKQNTKPKTVKHIVKQGDTLYSLSRLYNTTVEAIKSQNNLSSNAIDVGRELIITIN